jgi:DNA-binding winged helix-turn-helix (wHTH) protein/tetratricopeptide (TPR) repeat protein
VIFRFAGFEIDEEAGELRRDGARVEIQPKPFALLRLLVRERERVVPLDELFQTLWPDTAVTPGSLTRAVSHARRAIGDTHQGRLLCSFARRGYRFCGDVVEISREDLAAVSPGLPARGSRLPFVGRSHALACLQEAWSRSASGRGTLALVSGPPGVGKTRLVEVFCEAAGRSGALVLPGRAQEGEGVPAFWIWVQILRGLAAREELRTELRELAGAGELAGLVPELAPEGEGSRRGGPARRDAAPSAAERFLFFDAVERALSRASRRRPLVLVLEDLQWAGAPSLRLLEHLAFESTDDALLVVATLRDETRLRGHPLERTLALLRSLERCVQVPLRGLSRREVALLLEHAIGRPAPSDLTSELFGRTEGVPLFLREAIRLLEERGDLREPERAARRGITLPEHSLALLRRGLDSLSEAAASLLGAAAVLGREFAVPLLAGVAEVSREQALDLLDEATAAGVVEPVAGTPATWRFSHALHQEAAQAGLSPGQRARLHQRAARRLAQQHADDPEPVIAQLAHHHHRGLAVGDAEQAFACAARAAERATRLLAHEQAALHHEQALAALDHLETRDPARRLATLLALGEALRLSGERARRREVFGEALERARALGLPRELARAAIGLCDLSEWGVGDPATEAALAEALAAVGDGPSPERARLATRVAYLRTLTSRTEAEPRAREAVAMARALDDPDTLQDALYALHLTIGGPDDFAEREALTDEMQRAAGASASGDRALIALLDVACDRLTRGDVPGARQRREQARALAGERPPPSMVWHCLVYDSGIALLEGRLEEAEAHAREALQVGRRIEHPFALGCSRAHAALLARERGDSAGVLTQLGPALPARQGPTHWVKALVARAQLALGRREEARALFEDLAAGGFGDVPRNVRWTATLVEIAGLCAELGDAGRAARLVELLAGAEAQQGILPVVVCYVGPMSGALARLHALCGDLDLALELQQQALESCLSLEARPAEARTRLELAGLLARRRQRRDAERQLRESAAIARGLGLTAVEAAARAALAEGR